MVEQFDFKKYIKRPAKGETVEPPVMEDNIFQIAEEVIPGIEEPTSVETGAEKKVIPTLTPLFEEEYTCGFCKGKGERPQGSICPVCRGNKTFRLTPPVVKCAHCRGRGDEKPRSQVTCSACRGRGYISVTGPIERCPSCRGTGSSGGSKLPCMRCKGAGVVTIKTRRL